MSHRLTYIFLFLALLIMGTHLSYADSEEARFTVVIDPGHGGKDYGCIGDITNEKTIVLDVARQVGDLITSTHPEVRVIYTRSDDRFIELNERASIANKANADLFISIHVNSVDRRSKGRRKVKGASVYTLGLGTKRTDPNLAVAMRENSVIELEKDYTENYQGFDPNSTESYIIFELSQNLHQHQSIELGDAIQRELVTTAGRADKGVLQSGFLVLKATSMPAVLVELDFICNPECERFLNSASGREKCARSIANGFSAYYTKNKPTHRATQPVENQSVDQPVNNNEVTYSVQILTSPSILSSDDQRLKNANDVSYYFHDNIYKYISGSFSSLNKARIHLKKIKKHYPEAFIIKMRNGMRVM